LRRSGRDSRADFGVRLHVLTCEQLNLYHALSFRASATKARLVLDSDKLSSIIVPVL
jgi:hypothetical protein